MKTNNLRMISDEFVPMTNDTHPGERQNCGPPVVTSVWIRNAAYLFKEGCKVVGTICPEAVTSFPPGFRPRMSLRVPPFFSLLRVCAKPSWFRKQPMLTKGMRACYSSGKDSKEGGSMEEFVPSKEWKQVEDGQILPTGLEVNINLETGVNTARLVGGKETSESTTPSNDKSIRSSLSPPPPPPPPPPKKIRKRSGRLGGTKAQMLERLEHAKAPPRREVLKQNQKEYVKNTDGTNNSINAPKARSSKGGVDGSNGINATKHLENGELRTGRSHSKNGSQSSEKLNKAIPAFGLLSLIGGVAAYYGYISIPEFPSKSKNKLRNEEEPVFNTLEEYDAYRKKNPFQLDDTSSKTEPTTPSHNNKVLSMKERLKMYEEGLVEIRPKKTDSSATTLPNNTNFNAGVVKDESLSESPYETEKGVKPSRSTNTSTEISEENMNTLTPSIESTTPSLSKPVGFSKPLEKPSWMKERDEDAEDANSLFPTDAKDINAQVKEQLDSKHVVIAGFQSLLDKTREEERQYKRSIGLRTTRSLFSFAPRTGKTEEQNSRLKAFVAEKEALKLRIHSVRSSP